MPAGAVTADSVATALPSLLVLELAHDRGDRLGRGALLSGDLGLLVGREVVVDAHRGLVERTVAGATPRQLTIGDFDVLHPAWSPDGRRIAFAADRGPDSTISPRLQIWSVGTDAAKPRVRELASLAGDADRPSFSPDGRRLAFIGTDVDDPPDETPPSLWVMDLPLGGPRELTAELDRPIGEWAWCDLLMAEEAPGPAWLSNEELAVIVGDRGRDLPYRVTLDGTAASMIDPDTRIAACGLDVAGDRVAVSAALDGRAGAVGRSRRAGSARSPARDRPGSAASKGSTSRS